ncbi:Gfo/Idh/MocA family oxidoreductase [Candidatus Bathyarchaeota archaeon]|nr:Gfo/Idh/MocA family oxidoreductase [Candidatus Bathyarchaeota archaeon]
MKKVNTAVVGCGSWGKNHVRVLNQLSASNLVAVADKNLDTAREIGDKYRVKYFTDPYKIFNDSNIDFVSICTPAITHTELGLEAIRGGKHLLVEKPLSDTIQKANLLVKKARKEGVFLTVGFVERYNPVVEDACARINRGEVGEIILAHTIRANLRPSRVGGVGIVKDLALHDVDVITSLFNEVPCSVFAKVGAMANIYEDYANIFLSFKNNKSAFIESNWFTSQKIRKIRIMGKKAMINADYISQELILEFGEQKIKSKIKYSEPLYNELSHVLRSIQNDKQPRVTGEDGLCALIICEAALKSSKLGKAIGLKDIF